ncbi:MAG: hypothetical protein C4567_00075 [Deltaproteobacteria bacterium]|nr:MAG: hypothetical protein C4567_00075 [Deltaproteobacteria bacterium]
MNLKFARLLAFKRRCVPGRSPRDFGFFRRLPPYDSIEAHFDLGRVYALKGDRQKAIEAFNFIFSKKEIFIFTNYEAGHILEAWGEKGEALRQYRQALLFSTNFAAAKDAVQRLTEAQTKPAPSAPEGAKKNKKSTTKP